MSDRNTLIHELLEVKVGQRKLQNIKANTVVLVLMLLCVLSLTYSLPINTAVIHSTGQILTNKVTARSGSAEDIQTAVDSVQALGGGTVYVPAGNFSCNLNGSRLSTYLSYPSSVIVPNGVSIIGAGINQTILYQTAADLAYGASFMFYCIDNVPKAQQKPIRISGIAFLGYVSTYENNHRGVQMDSVVDFRIDHCSFQNFPGWAIGVWNPHGNDLYQTDARGVIDHCSIDNPYKEWVVGNAWGYGINAGGDTTWETDITALLGKYDGVHQITYVEDCTFNRCRHCIASNQGMFYVVRNCIFNGGSVGTAHMIDVHGYNGGRGLEAYNNTITGGGTLLTDSNVAFGIRGGGGCIFNNTINNCYYGIQLHHDPGEYDPSWSVHNMWIWDNTMTNGYTVFINSGNYTEGVDYFLYANSNYTPYTYPHPLTIEASP
jgi:hypothetical protein